MNKVEWPTFTTSRRALVSATLLSSVLAVGPARAEWCDEAPRWHTDAASACEVREHSLAPVEGTLHIDPDVNGSVRVDNWDGREFLVTARIDSWAEDASTALALAREVRPFERGPEGDRLFPASPKGSGSIRGSWSVSYRLLVPRGASLEITTINGGVEIYEFSGALRFRTTNGRMVLDRPSGQIEGESVNGRIEIALERATEAKIRIGTVNGDIALSCDGELGRGIDAETKYGKLVRDFSSGGYQGDQPTFAAIELRSLSGDIAIRGLSR